MLALTGAIRAPDDVVADALAVPGLVLLVLGTTATLTARTRIGASWRIGVDDAERTDLVTTGVFALVRNPIFTAMAAAQAGLALAVPTAVSLAALLHAAFAGSTHYPPSLLAWFAAERTVAGARGDSGRSGPPGVRARARRGTPADAAAALTSFSTAYDTRKNVRMFAGDSRLLPRRGAIP